MERSAGILLPLSSLPSPGGIGTLGDEAYRFLDFLAASGQRVWQMLPAGPTGYADSPYSSFSAFAGNPYFIDPELLRREGFLTAAELAGCWGADPRRVDYGVLYERRLELLRAACRRELQARGTAELDGFRAAHGDWLPDYALFMALKRRFGMRSWRTWPRAAARRESAALAKYRRLLQDETTLFSYIQMVFFRQWAALKRRAGELGVRLMGDAPIYVAMDSADVWAHPENYQLDGRGRPLGVAGVPPDYFCADGQLWGNPLYDWGRMARDGYRWWSSRIRSLAQLYDLVRIDHFRGFVSYWRVPYGARTARGGRWVRGPGEALVTALRRAAPELEIVAEDLGVLTPPVCALLEKTGLPGMKVLEFAFAGRNNPYLPHKYPENCACYTGTHDNPPVLGWEAAEPVCARKARAYFRAEPGENLAEVLIRGGLESRARLFIAQMQDWLELDGSGRINSPGTVGGNWTWRMLPGEYGGLLASRIRWETVRAGRAPAE